MPKSERKTRIKQPIYEKGGEKAMEALAILASLAPVIAGLGVFFAGLGVLIWGSKTGKD